MVDQNERSDPAQSASLSEAERMSKIRELLVGPAIADESARVDQSVERLNEVTSQQAEIIDALQSKIRELEDLHQANMKNIKTRLLGIMEALLTDEEELRARLMNNETLRPKLDVGNDDNRG